MDGLRQGCLLTDCCPLKPLVENPNLVTCLRDGVVYLRYSGECLQQVFPRDMTKILCRVPADWCRLAAVVKGKRRGESKMGKLHFMAMLGFNPKGYTYCTYQWENRGRNEGIHSSKDSQETKESELFTRYAQLATLSKVLNDHPQEEIRVTIFLTEKAREFSWEGNFVPAQVPEGIEEDNPGLKKALLDFKEKYPEILIDGIDNALDVSIPDGKNQKEQDEIFRTIYESIGEEEQIFFDLTHSFRSIPILAITVLNYARAVKNIRVGGLYYGAFDARDANGGKAPIFDMTYCDSVMQWTAAAESFLTSGSSNQIQKVYKEQSETREHAGIKKAVDDLNRLTNCLETSRGRQLAAPQNGNYGDLQKSSSIKAAYEGFAKSCEDVDRRGATIENSALRELFDKIRDETAVLGVKVYADGRVLEQTSIGVTAVRWAIQKGLTQQGLTALEATLTTYVGEVCGFTDLLSNDRGRGIIYNILSGNGSDKITTDEYVRLSGVLDSVLCGEKSRLYECTEWTKDARNSINHFGLIDKDSVSYNKNRKQSRDQKRRRNQTYTYDQLIHVLRERYGEFLQSMENTGCRLMNEQGDEIPWGEWFKI